MKTISAVLARALMLAGLLALLSAPARAEDEYQSTMSGTVAIKVVPKASAKAEGQAEETLTIQFVKPPREKAKADDDDDLQRKLLRCGRSWNKKLQDYETQKQVTAQIKSTLVSSNDRRSISSPPKLAPSPANRPAVPKDAAPVDAKAPPSAGPKTAPVSDDGSQVADTRILSRLDYRLCMYRCLGDANAACPFEMTTAAP
jgi:hypothetical protein